MRQFVFIDDSGDPGLKPHLTAHSRKIKLMVKNTLQSLNQKWKISSKSTHGETNPISLRSRHPSGCFLGWFLVGTV
jgi:hypothetical protein